MARKTKKKQPPGPRDIGAEYDATYSDETSGLLSRKAANRAIEEVLKGLCKARGIVYALWKDVPFDIVNTAKSLDNQARQEALCREDWEGYAERMLTQYCENEDVDDLEDPAPIGWVYKGEIVYVDGNHRHQGRASLGSEFMVWPEIYILLTDDTLALERLTFELNPHLRGTTCISKGHQFVQAKRLITVHGLSQKDARQAVGLPETYFNRMWKIDRVQGRLKEHELGIVAEKLGKTHLQKLGSLQQDEVLCAAAQLAHKHKLTVPGVTQLVNTLREEKNSTDRQLAILKAQGATLVKDQPPSSARGTKLHPKLKTINTQMGGVCNTDVALIAKEVQLRGATYRDHVLEKVLDARNRLDQLFRALRDLDLVEEE